MNCTKSYIGILTQGGPAVPQELIAKTDFTKPIIWEREEEGKYVGSCSNGWTAGSHVLVNVTADGSVVHAGAIITGAGEITLYFSNEGSVNTINLEIKQFL